MMSGHDSKFCCPKAETGRPCYRAIRERCNFGDLMLEGVERGRQDCDLAPNLSQNGGG
jgi:hypothetical protein